LIDPDDAVSSGLNEARTKTDAAREALQAALDAQKGDVEPIRQAIAWLFRIASEVEGVGESVMPTEPAAR
jgi:hypothetical protein